MSTYHDRNCESFSSNLFDKLAGRTGITGLLLFVVGIFLGSPGFINEMMAWFLAGMGTLLLVLNTVFICLANHGHRFDGF